MPESARWLALRGRPEEAIQAFQTVQGVSESEAKELVNLMTKKSVNIDTNKNSEETESLIDNLKDIIKNPYSRQALVIGVGLVLFQQLSGQPSVLYFANVIHFFIYPLNLLSYHN